MSDRALTNQSINWFPGHMTKTLRLIEADIKRVDMTIELVDARAPSASKNPVLERLSRNKPRLIVLNKCDLADPKVTARWRDYYSSRGYGVAAVNCKDRKQALKCVGTAKSVLSERLGALQSRGMTGAKPRAMVVGVPNVGKSTFINSLSGYAPTKAEDRPGVTRGKQWVTLRDIELLDMPGVLWPKLENQSDALLLAFTGAIKDDVLDTVEISALLLQRLSHSYPDSLRARFGLSDAALSGDGYAMLEAVAKRRGMLISGGAADTDRAAAAVLDETRSGKLGRISYEAPEDDSQ